MFLGSLSTTYTIRPSLSHSLLSCPLSPLSLNLLLLSTSPSPHSARPQSPSPAQSIPGKVLEQYLGKGIRYRGGESCPYTTHRWLIPGQFWAFLSSPPPLSPLCFHSWASSQHPCSPDRHPFLLVCPGWQLTSCGTQ